MTRIIFRCDASLSIGSGHVMRCRTLARELTRRGAESIFICRLQEGNLSKLLGREFKVLELTYQEISPDTSDNGTKLKGRDLYAAWLGRSQCQDAENTLEALWQAGINNCDWLVVDHYGLDATWEQQVRMGLQPSEAQKPRLLVIDDLADRPHQADCLLDQNFFEESFEDRYLGLVPEYCRQLIGPHYALLGSEYAQLHPLVTKRTELHRVLIFFGGADPQNLTSRAVAALTHHQFEHLLVDVVIGRQNRYLDVVQALTKKRSNMTIHQPMSSLAGLISRADLAIGASGSTTWERACLGLPSAVVSFGENQAPIAQALHDRGFIYFIGHAEEVNTADIATAVSNCFDLFSSMASSHELTDGYGSKRVATALLGCEGAMCLRPVEKRDEAILYRWAIDTSKGTKRSSVESISENSHREWLREGVASYERLHWIAIDASGIPLGQIRIDGCKKGKSSTINFWLDRAARGHGLNELLIKKSFEAIEKQCNNGVIKMPYLRCENKANLTKFIKPNLGDDVTISRSACNKLALGPSCITLLSDAKSWLNEHLPLLIKSLWERGHSVRWIHHHSQLINGDVCLLLSCGRILETDQLALHRYNLVIHESALPKGRGWSPMTWQIIEGASEIPITLFEANSELDSGLVYLQNVIELNGSELLDEWRLLQAQATIALCLEWFDLFKDVKRGRMIQKGPPSYYRRRTPIDSEIDPTKPLIEQFNLLRVADNKKYPLFFEYENQFYRMSVHKSSDNLKDS